MKDILVVLQLIQIVIIVTMFATYNYFPKIAKIAALTLFGTLIAGCTMSVIDVIGVVQ